MDACVSSYGVQLHTLLSACVWTKDPETVITPTDVFHVLGYDLHWNQEAGALVDLVLKCTNMVAQAGEEVNDGGVRASGPSGATLGPTH